MENNQPCCFIINAILSTIIPFFTITINGLIGCQTSLKITFDEIGRKKEIKMTMFTFLDHYIYAVANTLLIYTHTHIVVYEYFMRQYNGYFVLITRTCLIIGSENELIY